MRGARSATAFDLGILDRRRGLNRLSRRRPEGRRRVSRRGGRPPLAARPAQREARPRAHQHDHRRGAARTGRGRGAPRARRPRLVVLPWHRPRRPGAQQDGEHGAADASPERAAGPLQTSRSQHHNRIDALALLRARLWAREHNRLHAERAEERRAQLGSGMRGDKRRTIRCQDGTVVDHVTGRRWELRAYLRGNW